MNSDKMEKRIEICRRFFKVPVYEGGEAYQWLIDITQYFDAFVTPETEKIAEIVKRIERCDA